LQIVPKGLLLSKYIKNDLIINPDNLLNIEKNSMLSDSYQTFIESNNTVNLIFQLKLYNNDSRNDQEQPSIVSVEYIIISNDPNFNDIFICIPSPFVSSYNLQTNYIVDLSSYNIATLTLPATQSITFDTTSGDGTFVVKGWELSGSSGLKRVFFKLSVILSDGSTATYPSGFHVCDEIIVVSNYTSAPTVPILSGKSTLNYVNAPVYFEAHVAPNSGIVDCEDSGIAVYLWDALILAEHIKLARNNYSAHNLNLFKTLRADDLPAVNDDKLPIIFTSGVSSGIGSTGAYNTYITSDALSLSQSNTIYFCEFYINNNISDVYSWSPVPSLFWEINIVNSQNKNSNVKFLRHQLIADLTFKTLTIYTSIDDGTWMTDVNYIPSARYTSKVITSPNIVAQVIQSGSFILLVDCMDVTNKIFNSKLLFKPKNSDNQIILNELIFTSSYLGISTSIQAEYKTFIKDASTIIALESTQCGVCYGTISAATTPNDKLLTNKNLPVVSTLNDLYTSELLNTWFILSNSPSSGVVNANGSTITLFNRAENDSQNNLSSIEIQNSIPTFAENANLSLSFSFEGVIPNPNTQIKTGYSFDSNLNYSNFIFTDLLKTSAGLYLPQNNSAYDYAASLNWSGNNQFDLSVRDQGAGQTCSISTTKTNNLFFYSKENYTGALTPPTIIKTISSISSSNTFSAWIGTNGFDSSLLINQSIVIKNQGIVPVTISTGLGINTIAPGQPYIISAISTNINNPTNIIINTTYSSISSSVNFLYDFGQLGIIDNIGLTIQITIPPDCPATLPSIQYSIEVSNDFITWVYLTDTTAEESFDPNSGNLTLLFDTPNNVNDDTEYRYARLRIYYNALATFDPRKIWRYSLLLGSQTTTSSAFNTTGKFIVGFTDMSARDGNLGQLYNQPTFLRQFIYNSSNLIAIIFDFTDYVDGINGPVYLSLLTESGETRFKTIANKFTADQNYDLSFIIKRGNFNEAFKLKPSFKLTGPALETIDINLDDIINEPYDIQSAAFGYYPFISLVGNGKFDISSNVIKGAYNYELEYFNHETKFSLFTQENTDYTANYAKGLLCQNSIAPASYSFPVINSYFTANSTKNFNYDNITFTVKVASTKSIALYGTFDVDGIYLTVCDYVLVSGQQDRTQNGIYQVQNQQWSKQSISQSEPTILVTDGVIFGDTLWMKDIISGDWIPNVIVCPFILENNNLLFTGVSSYYKYPQYIKLAVGAASTQDVNELNQVKLKLSNSPSGSLDSTDLVTQWNSVLQNNQLSNLNIKSNANNTAFMGFSISTSQLFGISTISFPAIYNLIISYAGKYQPVATKNSDFNISEYGSNYRTFVNKQLIYQLFSAYETTNIGQSSNSIINTSVYGYNVANFKTLQSGFSTDVILDNMPPIIGILSKVSDNAKSVVLGISTIYDEGSGLALARIVQKNPSNELIYGSWFGFNTNSFTGVSTLIAYPSFILDAQGLTTGEPLSGYYRYHIQVADNTGNIVDSNSVESFYYESALIDTQGPHAKVSFIDQYTIAPISITSSTVLTAQLFAQDSLSGVKGYRYKILPDGEFSNWIDYSQYADIMLPEKITDGILSILFQFKDFGNNVLYTDTTIINENIYVYTWNIISKLLGNVLFTVIENSTFDDRDVLIIGASKSNQATLYLWDASKLLELDYTGFGDAKTITAMLKVDDTVVMGTDLGQILLYQNGIVSGPYDIFTWGDANLPISKFEINKYNTESEYYIYATTLNIPRIFRTPITNLKNLSWEVVQTPPISVTGINVLNAGLWTGNQIYYSISSSYNPAILSPVLNYGISSVIVSSQGSKYTNTPILTINGFITSAAVQPVLQGFVDHLNLFSLGIGYTSGANVNISAPAAGIGALPAVGYAVTNSVGQIISIGITSTGYGYTQIPSVSIIGVSGIGSQAVATASLVYDSIYSVSVASAGIATTTTNISISVSGLGTGAILTPTFLYRISDINITSAGFGYTATPTVFINGISTIASVSVEHGSIQSVTVTGTSYTFPLSQTANITLVGGASTNWSGTFSTSSITFSTGSGVGYPGVIISSMSLSGKGHGISTTPSISFSSSIFNPDLEFVLSNDLILSQAVGSIYDIKSFDNKLFITSSTKDIIKLDYQNNMFKTDRIKLKVSSNSFEQITPINLAVYDSGIRTDLYFSVKEEPYIGVLRKEYVKEIFALYQNNILSFKPYNFDILSDWQLVKILNSNGIGTVKYGDVNKNTLLIESKDSLVYYQSTKNNVWFTRSAGKSQYMITFIFEATEGTQCAIINTFNTSLMISFTVLDETLKICYGYKYFNVVSINKKDLYNITFINLGDDDVFIYDDYDLIYAENEDAEPPDIGEENFDLIQYEPIIKFGCIFEPQEVTINDVTYNVFGTPGDLSSSSFAWHQIKFSFDTTQFNINNSSYLLNINHVMPNASSVRVIKTLGDKLYTVTKSIIDSRSTTIIPEMESQVYRFNGERWDNVTGTFEVYASGINSSSILVSPNDIGILGSSYFITGLIKNIPSRIANASNIILGLSSSMVYEESDFILTIIYPYNLQPSGAYLTLSNNNGLLNLPSTVYFAPSELVKTVGIGVGSTSLITSSTITASDGITTKNTSVSVLPIGIASIGINTTAFIGYSSNSVVTTVTFQSKPKTPRTFIITTNNLPVLSAPNNGVTTVLAGAISTNVYMNLGTSITIGTTINVTAYYRSSISTASIKANPFILSMGLSTNIFVGNQLYGSILLTASLQAPPKSNIPLYINTGLASVLNVPSSTPIFGGTLSTTIPLQIGSAVTSVLIFNITGTATGIASTVAVTANPFIIATATADIMRPVLGLQNSLVTFTLNTTPASSILIYNVVTNPSGVSMVFPSTTTVLAGSISTSFAISTTLQSAAGLGITIQGAPLGYNTTPIPGLTLVSDIWRITGFIVSPTSIVGAGANSNGVAQSFTATVTLNLGVSTTVILTSNTNSVALNHVVFSGTTSASSFSTGLSTAFPTGVAITALGPNGLTSSVFGLTLNPFLINNLIVSPIWAGGFSSNYIVGGIGATAVAAVILNAYTTTGVQTIQFTTFDTHLSIFGQAGVYPIIGLATVPLASNNISVNLGASAVTASISTNLTARIFSSTGIATTTVYINPIPNYSMIFDPVFVNRAANIYGFLNSPLPISAGIAITFNNGQNLLLNVNPSSTGVSSSYNYHSVAFDTTLIAKTVLLGIVQTYYVSHYAKSGGILGMGYNLYGELSSSYPVSGATGSYRKVAIGHRAVKTVSGNHHNLMLDYDGKVYGIGDNTYYQLGYENTIGFSTSIFKLIPFNLKARDIFAQNNTSYVILSDNSLYSFGSNNLYGLGVSAFTGVATFVPQLISTSVQLCSVYNDHGIIVTFNNSTGIQSVFEFGNGNVNPGIIGKGITQLSYMGTIRNISNMSITGVSAGPKHNVASGIWTDVSLGINSSGVFAWGDNTYYQIGTASTTGIINLPNVLHKTNSFGTASPIEYSQMIIADYNFSIVIGTGNTIYLVGAANSSNSAGTGLGNTQYATANYPYVGFTTNQNIYKISKNSKHYIWVMGIGSVYVSGGASPADLSLISNSSNAILFAENNSITDAPETNFQISTTDINVFGNSFLISDSNLITKYAVQPRTYSGSNLINNYDGFAVAIKPTQTDIYYYQSDLPAINNWTYNSSNGLDGIMGISIGVDQWQSGLCITSSGADQVVNIFAFKSTYNGLTTTVSLSHLIGITSYVCHESEINSLNTYNFIRSHTPVAIDATYLKNYIGLAYTDSSITYQWQTSSYNVAIGYDNGEVELYGNAYEYGYGYANTGTSKVPVFIGSWNVGGYISCMKSIQEKIGSNKVFLFIATKSNLIWSYNGNGGGITTGAVSERYFTQSTSFPAFIGYAFIPSAYGYITLINDFYTGSFIAATSNNYLLIANNTFGHAVTLSVSGAILVPGTITSILFTEQASTSNPSGSPVIFVTTADGTVYSYRVTGTPNYEIGLNYLNQSGSAQLMTYNGMQTGLGVTNIFAASTSDTFTLILDSSLA
jgi:alpha-tubulin suppressor-like RCC1 family protein